MPCLFLSQAELAALLATKDWIKVGGPYDSQAECLAHCCGCPGVPDVLHVTGSCTTTITRSGNRWSGSCTIAGCGVFNICLTCKGSTSSCDDFSLIVQCVNPCDTPTDEVCLEGSGGTTCSCDPFQMTYTCLSFLSSPCPGCHIDLHITITA